MLYPVSSGALLSRIDWNPISNFTDCALNVPKSTGFVPIKSTTVQLSSECQNQSFQGSYQLS